MDLDNSSVNVKLAALQAEFHQQRQKGYNHILELIARNKPLKDILTAIVLHAEKMLPGVVGSILLLDEFAHHLRQGADPSLPDFYNEAIDGIEIGPDAGSCEGTAYTGQPVIVSNVKAHHSWQSFIELTSKAGLAACWSLPILASNGSLLGTFAIYYVEAKEPDDSGFKCVAELARFSAIAIEQKHSMKVLVDARRNAENASHAKSQFLSNMSHELRTPMNAIIGFAQLLQMDVDTLNEVQMDNVNEIISASNHLLTLINEVLDLSKIEAGHIDFLVETVIVGEVLGECLNMIAHLAGQRGIDITFMCDGEKSSVEDMCQKKLEVQADKTRLKQVLFNLLSNAVKYNNENGKIIISSSQSDKGHVRISIQDTGSGITEEKQLQLFKAFNRLGAEHSEVEGTGIGLVIAKNIVEMMDGSIGVESTPDVGATFWIELPCDHARVDYSEKVKVQNNDKFVVLEKDEYTLLYVEDNPANLRLVAQLLAHRPDIKMLSAAEPMLGLDLAAEHKPDLILLDINLPGIDGFDMLKLLRDRKNSRDTPVVAVSANAMPRDIEKGLNAGFDHYVAKPIDVVELLSVVDEILLSI